MIEFIKVIWVKTVDDIFITQDDAKLNNIVSSRLAN